MAVRTTLISAPQRASAPVNKQTGTSYTFLDTDLSKLVTFSNGSAVAAVLPQAGLAGRLFAAGWFCWVENRGTGAVTITPATSTIDGAASLRVAMDQGIVIFSDGVNYYTQRGRTTDASILLSDIVTNNVTSDLHGFAPKSPGDATRFLNGDATPAYAAVKDSDLSLSATTANDVSTSKHGFAPVLPADSTLFLDGGGRYSKPPGNIASITTIGSGGPATLSGGVLNIPSYTGGGGGGGGEYPPVTTPPTLANWTWVNQGSATGSDVTGGVALKTPAVSGDSLKLLVRTLGGTPYAVIAAIFTNFVATNFFESGLCHYSSGDGKVTTFGVSFNTGSPSGLGVTAVTHTSPTAGGTTVAKVGCTYPSTFNISGVMWMKIADDGINRTYSYSQDGRNWTLIYSVTRTTFHTPDSVGFMINPNNTTAAGYITLVSWVGP